MRRRKNVSKRQSCDSTGNQPITRAVARRHPGPLVLAGDSAGGALAAAVAHAARSTGPAIAGQVLVYPGLGGDMSRGSYMTHAFAPMLTRDDVLFYHGVRYADGAVPDQLQLARLKKRKLRLRDEIAWCEDQLVPDIIA